MRKQEGNTESQEKVHRRICEGEFFTRIVFFNKVDQIQQFIVNLNDISFREFLIPTCKAKVAGLFRSNGMRLKYMSPIVTPLKHLTLTDLKLVSRWCH